jgi:hypothetical protein
MHAHRDTFKEVDRIATENGQLPDSYFWTFLQDTYATSQAVAVRRQAELKSSVRTLGRLLVEVAEDAHLLSREFFVGMWEARPDSVEAVIANRQFEQYFAGDVGDHLDPAIPQRDLAALITTSASVKTYVDQHVAHRDRKPKSGFPTFADLDGAIDKIGEVFSRYSGLLRNKSMTDYVPAHQDDSLAVFRQPWIRPGQD